jgi:hypothetical protein
MARNHPVRRRLLWLAAALALAAPAAAQLAKGQGRMLEQNEAKSAVFGIDMWGYSPTNGMEWRECIQPNGTTLYYTPDGVFKGKLYVDAAGQACFAYEDTQYKVQSCFAVERNGKGLIFRGGGAVFVTTKIIPGITVCRPDQLNS